jgi:microcompartment protein CcmK/EutM
MILGKVVGTIVSSQKADGMDGARYLLVNKCNPHFKTRNDFIIVLDLVGANNGELVMISESTSARETPATVNKPVDAIIIGIVDVIDEYDQVVYRK